MTHCATVTTAITYGILIMIFVFWKAGLNVTSQRINHGKNADNVLLKVQYILYFYFLLWGKKKWRWNNVFWSGNSSLVRGFQSLSNLFGVCVTSTALKDMYTWENGIKLSNIVSLSPQKWPQKWSQTFLQDTDLTWNWSLGGYYLCLNTNLLFSSRCQQPAGGQTDVTPRGHWHQFKVMTRDQDSGLNNRQNSSATSVINCHKKGAQNRSADVRAAQVKSCAAHWEM